jgi:hypothetical protein
MLRHSKQKKLYSRSFYVAKAIALATFPIVLLLLPKDSFNSGPDICIFTLLSGYHCWGCGLSRACMHLIHLDFSTAWGYNHLSFVVLPILCGLVVVDFLKTINTLRNYDQIVASIQATTTEQTEQ